MLNIVFPVELDEAVWLSSPTPRRRVTQLQSGDLANDCYFVNGPKGQRTEASGWDASGDRVRVTNLCGVRSGELLKRCPNCGRRKVMVEFGVEGREVNGQLRDQSNCNKCRASSR